MQLFKSLLCCAILCGSVRAQVKASGEYHEATTGLTLQYPVEMQVRDPQSIIVAGHLSVFGSMENAGKEHALAAQCIHPLLLADLPSGPADASSPPAARILFFEFNDTAECKAGFLYKDDERVAAGLAQMAIQLPGAVQLTKPLYFDYGHEKMHASVAAMKALKPDAPETFSFISTDGMYYHGHLLGWLVWASFRNLFNEVVKSNVVLDDGKTYPLLPFALDEHMQPPAGFSP